MFINGLSGEVDTPVTKVIFDQTRWVIDSRDNIQVSITSGLVETSDNSGETWAYSFATPFADIIMTSFIFTNGNILFMTDTDRFFLTDRLLSFFIEKFMYEEDGTTLYSFTHTPGGNNFYPVKTMDYTMPGDVLLWGNYTVTGEPVNMFYSDDFGQTLKIAYRFAGNYSVRHVHNCEYNDYDGFYYCSTGDGGYVDGIDSQTIWLKGSFNDVTKVWTWVKYDFGAPITVDAPVTLPHLKTSGWFFREITGVIYIYWGAESRDMPVYARGIWRCVLADFADPNEHERILELDPLDVLKINDIRVDRNSGILVAACEETNIYFRTNKILIANNFGHGTFDWLEFADNRERRLTSPNDNGFFRFDIRKYEVLQDISFFIKPSSLLWENYEENIIT